MLRFRTSETKKLPLEQLVGCCAVHFTICAFYASMAKMGVPLRFVLLLSIV